MPLDQRFTCKFCGQEFDSQQALDEHTREMHPEMTQDTPAPGTAMPGMEGTPGAEDELRK